MLQDSTHRKIKCVIWDLDNTLWDGVLLEDNNISLRKGVKNIIETLDERGILQSIASKNDYSKAITKLEEFDLGEYFLYPQINWNAKSVSIDTIVQALNIGKDAVAFIDDQPFERDEVKFTLPEIFCIDAVNLDNVLEMPEMNPRFITRDSKIRRLMYLNDIKRNKEEEDYTGTKEEFLACLDMILTITPVAESDLQRAEELTIRTHQLNSTGYTYSYEELDSYSRSEKHKLFIADLKDKYGTYGKIGLVLIECEADVWTIKLLLMSCRVMSRGVGTIMINYIRKLAQKASVELHAEFASNDRNRMMYITYKFTAFNEIEDRENIVVFKNDLTQIQPYPEYISVITTYE